MVKPIKTEVTYGRTPLGQLVYDLGFTKLDDSYLARKHKLPIAKVRDYRAAIRRGFKQGKVEAGKAAARRRGKP
jgi:hypothetical protein